MLRKRLINVSKLKDLTSEETSFTNIQAVSSKDYDSKRNSTQQVILTKHYKKLLEKDKD